MNLSITKEDIELWALKMWRRTEVRKFKVHWRAQAGKNRDLRNSEDDRGVVKIEYSQGLLILLISRRSSWWQTTRWSFLQPNQCSLRRQVWHPIHWELPGEGGVGGIVKAWKRNSLDKSWGGMISLARLKLRQKLKQPVIMGKYIWKLLEEIEYKSRDAWLNSDWLVRGIKLRLQRQWPFKQMACLETEQYK